MPANRHGTVDLLSSTAHVFVDENLNPVGKGSEHAAFSFKKADLERVRARRKELKLPLDEIERIQAANASSELANAERALAAAQARVDAARAKAPKAADEAAEAEAPKSRGKAT